MSGVIGTHNGKFHCDEAFACFMLKQLDTFKNHEIIRTRDPAELNKCDVVVDVGGVYDHMAKRYDHHQKEFTHTMSSLGILDFNTKLSSAGLIYAHYGKELIAKILSVPVDSKLVNIFFKKVYETYVEQLDAIDNGISQYEGTAKYQTTGGITGRVGHLNPYWNSENVNPDDRFKDAMNLVGNDFIEIVQYLYKVWWPARELVEQALDSRFEVDPSGRIILLENGGVPWKEHFFMMEEEKGLKDQNLTYMLFGDSTNSGWRVQAIPTDRRAQFENRLPLPSEWRSLRDDVLSQVSGIPDCVFVHTSGFIGGNKTREGAILMAKKALVMGATENMECEAKKAKMSD